MKLLTPQIGWVASSSQLFWTTSAGAHWREITPPNAFSGDVVSTLFLDTSRGWVLLGGTDDKLGVRFDLASTNDAGQHWSVVRVNLPTLIPSQTVLTGRGHLYFVDASHGWLNLDVESSANFRLAILVATEDGGVNWHFTGGPGESGPIQFVNANDGWLAGGPGNQHIYATRDGAKTWHELSIKPPPDIYPASTGVYQLPIFSDNNHALLSVTFSGPGYSGLAVVLYSTDDGGLTWATDSIIPHLPESYGGLPFPTAEVDSVIIVPASGNVVALTKKIAPDSKITGAQMMASANIRAAVGLSFVSRSQGWLAGDGKLLLTTDGGITWGDIMPRLHWKASPKPWTHSSSPFPSRTPKPNPATVSGIGSSVHIGFHTCEAPSSSTLTTWWNKSPFFDVGIYIGGTSRSCTNSNLSSNWVTAALNQGWGIMPLWVGPQAPCACKTGSGSTCVPFPHVFSSVAATAQSQGTAEANSAITTAAALGLTNSVIYYDMENYPSSTCGAAVRAFITGWDTKLMAVGYDTGVYGSPTDAQNDWAHTTNSPVNVWIAKTGSISYPPATVWGLSPLSNSFWATTPGSRIRQFLGNNTVTWNGVAMSIDDDIEDGTVFDAVRQNKSYSYTFTTIDYPSGVCTFAGAINNVNSVKGSSYIGQVVGSSGLSSGNRGGFLYNNGSFTAINYPNATGTNYLSTNDVGQVTGNWGTNTSLGLFIDTKGTFNNFVGCDSTGTHCAFYINGINDDGQIVGTDGCCVDGFLYSNGTYTVLTLANGDQFSASGINGQTQIVGTDTANDNNVGAIYYSSNTSSTFNFPGALATVASGINNNGQIVGYYWGSDGISHGFLLDNNVFKPFDFPGARDTSPSGINDAGQIVGEYDTTNNACSNTHAFLANPQS
jgi:probable HAF family extracellular repeat protein